MQFIRLTKKMTITKAKDGFLYISDIIDGYLVVKKYLYYTKKEAIKHFKSNYSKNAKKI